MDDSILLYKDNNISTSQLFFFSFFLFFFLLYSKTVPDDQNRNTPRSNIQIIAELRRLNMTDVYDGCITIMLKSLVVVLLV